MLIVDINKIQMVSFSDLLEKAGFKHGYYTNLVPQKIMGKDGVVRIHWVNPDKGKKEKLSRVFQSRDGTETEHHAEIKKDHAIDSAALVRFSAGDKVVGLRGGDKGREGVLRSNLAGVSPRVTVAFHNPATDKHEAKVMNVNHIALVHRANPDTEKLIARKTVEVTDINGKKQLLNKDRYAAFLEKKLSPDKTPKERAEEAANTFAIGNIYRSSPGAILEIIGEGGSGEEKRFILNIHELKPGKKKTHSKSVSQKKLEYLLDTKAIARVPSGVLRAEANRLAGVKPTKPLSTALELGDLHQKGHFAFDVNGKRVSSAEDDALARQILAENWTRLENAVAAVASKYKGVPEGEITASTILDGLSKGVVSYDPMLDKTGGLSGRLDRYAEAYAKSECEKAQLRSQLLVSASNPSDEGVTPGSLMLDAAIAKEAEDESAELRIPPFISAPDTILLTEGLNDEADLMSWLYGSDDIRDIMMRWTGLGKFEADLTAKEAAAALSGLAYNPKTMEPYTASGIETWLLPNEKKRIIAAFQEEGKQYPEFRHTMESNVKLRDKVRASRKMVAADAKDFPTIAETHAEIKAPAGRAKMAADLVRLGIPMNDAHYAMDLADRILSGAGVAMDEYAKRLPHRMWGTAPAILETWFKEKFKKDPKTFLMAPAIREYEYEREGLEKHGPVTLMRRFDVVSPFRRALTQEFESGLTRLGVPLKATAPMIKLATAISSGKEATPADYAQILPRSMWGYAPKTLAELFRKSPVATPASRSLAERLPKMFAEVISKEKVL